MAEQSEEEFKQVDKFIITQKVLGKGSFAVVKQAFFRDDIKKLVAAKIISLENNNDVRFVKLLKTEINVLQKVKHEHLVRLYHATRTQRNLYMFLEYCSGGDLKSLLAQKGGKLAESEAIMYFQQIVAGFTCLYENNIIHRDIKPANILISDGKAKISDFGFSKIIEGSDLDICLAITILGTPLYMSPQMLSHQPSSSKCDVWSLGLVLYEMLYGRTPWTGRTPQDLLMKITKDKENPLKFPESPPRSQMVKDILTQMLKFNDADRISWRDIFTHPLIKVDPKEIQQEIEKIEEEEKDDLMKSNKINQFYLQKNKVVGFDKKQNQAFKKLHTIESQKESEHIEENLLTLMDTQEFNQEQQDNYQQVLEKQNEQKYINECKQRIDNIFTYKRNVHIFVNLTTNMIFKLYKENIIQQLDIYQIIFLLQKFQLIGFTQLKEQLEKKEPNEQIKEKEWKIYGKQKEYRQTIDIIKNDIAFIKPYFKEIFQRTTKYLQQKNSDDNIQLFQKILNDDFNPQDQFTEVYQKTLKKFNQSLTALIKDKVNEQQFRRELLQVIKYIQICEEPFIFFKCVMFYIRMRIIAIIFMIFMKNMII